MIQIRLFGEVGATAEDGAAIDVGPAKCQLVLAALALSPGSAVSVSRIIELVWGADPPRTSEKTLQSYVTRLRKGLGPDAISRTGVAYRLNLAAEAVDIIRFQRSIERGDVDGALQEWLGEPLAGLAAPGFAAVVDGLVEQWLGVVETDLERSLDNEQGSADGAGLSPVIGRLTELTAQYPFREGLWALLMTALYRAGRQGDALAAYRTARSQLVERLGVEPGPRLRELEASILGQDERLSGGGRAGRDSADLPTGTVTFGFTEVRDSARLWAAERHRMTGAMARHDQLIHDLVADHGGHVFASGGDSTGVAFHRAGAAVAWAEAVQAAIQAEDWPGGIDLRVGVVLHPCETEELAGGYFGPAVMVAAALAAAGHGGQTLSSALTASLVDGVRFRSLGLYRLEGVVGEQQIMQLGDDAFPPLQTEDRRRGNLPRPVGRLVGRAEELELIGDALARSAMVTLIGPGGIGKTRLAQAVAQRHEATTGTGAWMVELADTGSPADVPRAVADALDVQETPGRSLSESVVAALSRRRALLMLDNCEHVVDGAAEIAKALTERCPDLSVLATSREGLGLTEEQLIVVPPLDPLGPAMELFNERAGAASSMFDEVEDQPHVQEICQQLDGVPLAIELAAARTSSLAPVELVSRLDDRLRLLSGGRRGSAERHRTLRATIGWSYELLAPAEQLLFQRLSIFAGPFDLQAAEMVAADDRHSDGAQADAVVNSAGAGVDSTGPPADGLAPVDVDDLLGSLVDKSMLTVESGQFGRRFKALETMRQFGAEHLLSAGGTDVTAARHASWCLQRVSAVRSLLEGNDEVEGVARLAEVWRNLRAAFDWACDVGDHRLAHALLKPVAAEVYMRSQTEIGDWAERLLTVAPAGDEEVRSFGLIWAARRYMRTLDGPGFQNLIDRFGQPDEPLIHYAKAFIESDPPALATWAPIALQQLQENGDDYGARLFEVAAINYSLMLNGRLEELDARCADQIERFRVTGPPTCLHWALTIRGFAKSLQGSEGDGWEYFREASEVVVPDRTHSMRNPLAARGALARGQRLLALQQLGAYVEDLLDNDNFYLSNLACSEFINMMMKLDRLSEAAVVLGHLEAKRAMRSRFFEQVKGDTERRMAGDPDGEVAEQRRSGARFGDREALVFISDVLRRLAEEPGGPSG